MGESQEDIYYRFARLHDDVIEEFKEHQDEYWQGKKDAFRIARVFMLEMLGDDSGAESALRLRESSTAARSTRIEKLEEMARQARFYIGEALWMARDDVPLHPMSRINWKRWVSWYDAMQKQGIVPEADGAID